MSGLAVQVLQRLDHGAAWPAVKALVVVDGVPPVPVPVPVPLPDPPPDPEPPEGVVVVGVVVVGAVA